MEECSLYRLESRVKIGQNKKSIGERGSPILCGLNHYHSTRGSSVLLPLWSQMDVQVVHR
jgi:hypothetical protein